MSGWGMVGTLHGLALVLYLAATAIVAGSLAGGRRSPAPAGVIAAFAGVLVHAGALAAYASTYDELPLVGLAPSLSTLAFLIAGLQMATASLRDAGPLGLILTPISAVLLGIALALGIAPTGHTTEFQGAWFGLHVVLAFVGYAGLAVAFAAGLLYLLQFRTLKGKQFGRVFRFFPSLEAADRLGRHGLVVGFPSLTLALVIGWAWTIRFERGMGAQEAQVIWGMLTWVVFVAALLARRGRAPAADRRGALASVLGFVVVVLAFVVLRLSLAEGQWFL